LNQANQQASGDTAPDGAKPRKTPQKDAISWGSLSGKLDPTTRDEVARRFRSVGGDFGRWNRADLARLADAITATEDRLEQDAPRSRDRVALRDFRRRLEVALWP
jgi:hypothetical protein